MARLSLGEALTNLVWAKVSLVNVGALASASSYVIYLNESVGLLPICKVAYTVSLVFLRVVSLLSLLECSLFLQSLFLVSFPIFKLFYYHPGFLAMFIT